MAEKRMLARAVSQSRKVNSLSLKAALLWTWAIPWFDGYGYLEAEPDFLKLNIVPRRNDISIEDMPGVLRELSRSGLWKLYKDKETSKQIAFDPKFKEFQNLRMDREGKQRFTPGALLDYSGSTPAEDKIREVKIIKDKEYTVAFLSLWASYPNRNGRKQGKQQAFQEWKKLSPSTELQSVILFSLSKQKEAHEDAKKHQEFSAEFPDLCRWLKNRRWEDEIKIKPWTQRVEEAE